MSQFPMGLVHGLVQILNDSRRGNVCQFPMGLIHSSCISLRRKRDAGRQIPEWCQFPMGLIHMPWSIACVSLLQSTHSCQFPMGLIHIHYFKVRD